VNVPVLPPPPEFDDDRSQAHPAPAAPAAQRPREWAAWTAIGLTLLGSVLGIYGSHVNAIGQIERLEERVTANEEAHGATRRLLSEISTEIAGLRSDVQGLERVTQVQLTEMQRRMERAERVQSNRRR
jgi:hypothetical protein